MRTNTHSAQGAQSCLWQRALSVLVALCLLLGNVSGGLVAAYAAEEDLPPLAVGQQVTASVQDGVLTLSGTGATMDFTAETAPFLPYAAQVHTLVIEEGVTYLGAYLFYGLGNLGGKLVLPASVAGFGDFAFSGASWEAAPKFTLIQNLFQQRQVTRPVQTETPPETLPPESPAEPASQAPEAAAEQEAQPPASLPETELPQEAEAPASETAPTTQISAEAAPLSAELPPTAPAEDSALAEPAVPPTEDILPEPDPTVPESASAVQEPASAAGESVPAVPESASVAAESVPVAPESAPAAPESAVETVVVHQQEIPYPETLFYQGQTGAVLCHAENASFLQAALLAGYRAADRVMSVTLDGAVELELPVANGQLCLPERPAQIVSPYEDDALFTYAFSGWTRTPADSAAPVLSPGELLTVEGESGIALFSVWEAVSKYQLKTAVEIKDGVAVYTVADGESGAAVSAPEGYAFAYQWQLAAQGGGDAAWENLEGATQAMYQRPLEPASGSIRLRCAVTVQRLVRTRTAAAATLYSEPVSAAAETVTIYVDQTNGSDSNDGLTQNTSVQTLDAAAAKLKTEAEGGSVETNQIRIVGTYTLLKKTEQDVALFSARPVPATIKGADTTSILTAVKSGEDCPLMLSAALTITDITVKSINHIYGNGHDITIGNSVTTQGTIFYLYGGGRSDLNNGIGKVTALSGDIARIVGYVRSRDNVVATNGWKAEIAVGGTAAVGTIVAGNASGSIENADVEITVSGGKVTTLVGGNQGFSGKAEFKGNTAIHITGGEVTNIYGAGTGRNNSIPTFKGTLKIDVTGGAVTNIYGAGEAGVVTSDESTRSQVEIAVSGGTVGNIYAAGLGGNMSIAKKTSDGAAAEFSTPAEDFGSLTGDAAITITGGKVTGNIYASGAGYKKTTDTSKPENDYATTENAYLNGSATIAVRDGGTVEGSIYGGGKGIAEAGYENCARVVKDSTVTIAVEEGGFAGGVYGGGQGAKVLGNPQVSIRGIVAGSVYGGGQEANAQVAGNTKVTVSGGVEGSVYGGGQNAAVGGSAMVEIASGNVGANVYGGGENAAVTGATTVWITGDAAVDGSAYGGAKGTQNAYLTPGGCTVNMTGGWVQGNLYGGSELSSDGPKPEDGTATVAEDRVFVNLVGGTVSGNVFGGGYGGTVQGSTHLHIGQHAPQDCEYYKAHPMKIPTLHAAALRVDGSVYAGGDYGSGSNYDAITVTGTSHVYIDGTGYDTGAAGGEPVMNIAGGVFGSGASCDAGSTRLVTLKNYGARLSGSDGIATGTTRALDAIQRADRVLLNNAHVQLKGKSDQANANQTALYSLNRIGDHGLVTGGNGLVLKGGSTLVLDSAMIETANFSSVDAGDGAVTLANVKTTANTVKFSTGTVFRISYTDKSGKELYGAVSGYAYLLAEDTADAYAYARRKTEQVNPQDGGFAGADGQELSFTDLEADGYRYWRVAGSQAVADRHTVLTAQTMADGADAEGYAVASGSIELPPAAANKTYTIESVTLPGGLTLADAAKSGDAWLTSATNGDDGTAVDLAAEKKKISETPLTAFGLLMQPGAGFAVGAQGKVLSGEAAKPGGTNSVIGQISVATTGGVPHINFALTYWNEGITVSKNLGTVAIVLVDDEKAKTTLHVEIVTKASKLADQEVDLYATQSGSYTGRLIIPAGAVRQLSLASVADQSSNLVSVGTVLGDAKFSLAMQPEGGAKGGWQTTGLMTEPYDLGAKPTAPVPLGKTDDRYEAAIQFTLSNPVPFSPKDAADQVILTLQDTDLTGKTETATITLNVHWKNSVVAAVSVGKGRQYDGAKEESGVSVSRASAFTASFRLSEQQQPDGLWLELRKDGGERMALPAGTRLTLLGAPGGYYTYQVVGGEAENKIFLSAFQKMWGSEKLTSQLQTDDVLTVIVDFAKASSGLSAGSYGLRLRNETGADTMQAAFAIQDGTAAATLAGGEQAGEGVYKFLLTVTPQTDSHWLSGAAAALSLPAGESFLPGTRFACSGMEYYPAGGTVYIPLSGPGLYEIAMDTTQTTGLSAGTHTLNARVFSTGWNAMDSTALSATTTYEAKAAPSYGLGVKLKTGERIVKAGDTLTFDVSYKTDRGGTIAVSTYQKSGDSYTESKGWAVNGSGAVVNGSGTQTVTVTAPKELSAGTYRLVFSLGDQTVPYNVIVQ